MSIKITIGQKFSFAFLIILLLMALTFGIVIKSYNNVITNLETTNEDASKQGAAGNVRFSIAQLIMFANDYIITEKDYYRQMFKQQHKQVEDYQKKLRMFCFSSREIAIVDSIAVDVDSINTYAHRIFAISKLRSSSNAAALMEIMDYKFGDAVSRKTTEIFDIVFSRIEELRIQSARSKEQMLQTIYTVFILALLVSLAFVYLSVQRIVKPIKTIVKAADEIAKGDYTQRPVVTTHDEVASLARSFSKMAGAIEKSYQELEARKRFKENIYAAVPSGLLVFGEEAKVLSVNRSFCELFNLQYQQIVGQSIDDVLQLIGISRKCRDAVAAREPFRNLECMSPGNAKEKMILNLTLFGMRNAEEEILLVIEDITERRIAEEMIKKSEDLIRTTLYSIGDAVITTDEHGIVQRLNPAAEHLTCWKESDAQGKSIEDVFNIINEETRNKVENPVQKVLREGAVVGLANHTLLISKDGREAPIADSGAPIKNETGGIVGVVLVFRDQTEEREKQKALELSHLRLKEAQRMAYIGNWELDLQKNELYWSDEIFRIFEIDPAEFETSYEVFLNLVHPDEREFVNDAYTNSVKNKMPYSIDHRLLMKDGRIKYVHEQCETYYDDQGYPIRSVGTVQNITERVKAKALIAEQAEQLNVILATTTDGFWVVDQFGKIIDVNDAYCKMSGYTRDEILSFSISDLDEKESAEETADRIKKLMETGSDIFESVHKSKDGRYFFVEVSVSYSPARKQFLGFSRDITERKRAEENRLRIERIVDNSQVILFHWLAEPGWPVSFVSEGIRQFGYTTDDFYSRRLDYSQIVYPEDQPRVTDEVKACLESRTDRFTQEYRIVTKTGDVRWLDDRTLVIRDQVGNIQHIEGTVLDITERKRAEEELQESEKKHRTLIDNIQDGVFIIQDAKMQFVNEAFARMVGFAVEEVIGMDFRQLVAPEDLEIVADRYRRRQAGEDVPKEYEFRSLHKDGKTRIIVNMNVGLVDYRGRAASMGTVKNITERKRAEEALRASEERVRLILENVHDVVTILAADGTILYQSPSLEQVVGYTPEEIVNKSIWEFIHPEDLPQVLDTFNSALPILGAARTSEFRFRRKDGLWCVLESIGKNLLADPVIHGVIISSRDITERKRADEEMRLLLTLAQTIAEAEDFDSALTSVLRMVIESTSWDFGEVWIPSSDSMYLELSPSWYCKSKEVESFRIASKGFTFAPGVGLPGRVWSSKKPAWISEVIVDPNFPRAPFAKEVGFKDAVGIPIVADNYVVAVMEFFLREVRQEEKRVVALVSAVATQLGTLFQRKRAEAELAEREKRYRALFNLSPSGIVLEDVDGNIVEVNEAYCKSSGYSPEELIGRNVRMVASPEETPHIEDHIALLRSGKTLQHAIENVRKDGTRCWMELYETLISLQGSREGFLVVAHDISERKRAEEELLKIGTAVEQTADCVVITDRDGIIQYVNTAFLKIFGYSKEEILGKKPRIIKSGLHPPEFFKALWNTILSGEVFTATFINKRKDGELVYEIKTITPIKDKEGNITHFVSTAKEITEQRHAEEALQKSEERYYGLIEHASDGIFIADAIGKYIEVNHSGCTMLGYTRDEILQKTIQDLTKIPSDKPLRLEELRQGKTLISERELIRKDGSLVPVEISAKQLQDGNLLGIVRDITERKKLEKELKEYREHLEDIVKKRTIELRQSKERFRALAESSEDTIMRFNRKLQHLYVNPVVEKQTGIKAEEFIGKTHKDLGFPEDLILLWETALENVFGNKGKNRIEFKLPNGIWIDWIIIPEFDEDGKVNTVITSGRDITELKEYEKKINEALQKEKELNQLKSTFISTASHQFRTPLASILSSAQMIKRYTNKWSEEKLNEHYGRINESIKNLTHLMDEVLLIGKSEEGKNSLKPEYTDIEKLFNKLIEEVKPLLNEKQEINYKNRAGKKYFKLDIKALHQIVNNLLSNAVKYSPEGGKIKIETGMEGGKLKITVEDEGIGIPKEEIKYIFDSFYRTTNSANFPGTGLGLNIVKRIVDLYKGTIDVASVLNKGTKFTVKLPVSAVNE